MVANLADVLAGDRTARSTLDTLEARWFAQGDLPPGVLAWFTRHGTMASVERRADRYFLDPDSGVGTKMRNDRTLEVKSLRAVHGIITPPWDTAAPLESWRKRDFADRETFALDAIPSTVVKKQIFTRIFTSAPASDHMARCEVEIATLTVGRQTAWTLAFEASGASHRREPLLRWALAHLTSDGMRVLDIFRRELQTSASYPEWLANRAVRPPEPHLRTHADGLA